MCGRFAITNPRFNRIEAILGTTSPEVRPRYNISPSQTIPVILECAEGVHELVEMRWGARPALVEGSTVPSTPAPRPWPKGHPDTSRRTIYLAEQTTKT